MTRICRDKSSKDRGGASGNRAIGIRRLPADFSIADVILLVPMRPVFLFILLGCFTLTGCGVPGAPQPPSTGIPKFIGDLKAARKGDTVTLTWTTPTDTSDGELIRKPGKMVVERALGTGHEAELNFQPISELPLEPT